jgi:flagellar FliL protein
MAVNPANIKPAPEPPPENGAPANPGSANGGIKPWLPLLANIILMPVLAYATITFLVLPKIGAAQPAKHAASAASEAAAQPAHEGKQKFSAPLSAKVLVNVAGTMGTRYLLANITLVGTGPDLKTLAEKNDAEMRDAAASALSIKTISDLEKPGARNLIRAELISVFNNILGQGVVSDIYLTEFAIQ